MVWHNSVKSFNFENLTNDIDPEVEDLHRADEGEPGEETHGAADSRKLVHKLGRTVLQNYQSIKYRMNIILDLLDLVKRWGGEGYLDKFQLAFELEF